MNDQYEGFDYDDDKESSEENKFDQESLQANLQLQQGFDSSLIKEFIKSLDDNPKFINHVVSVLENSKTPLKQFFKFFVEFDDEAKDNHLFELFSSRKLFQTLFEKELINEDDLRYALCNIHSYSAIRSLCFCKPIIKYMADSGMFDAALIQELNAILTDVKQNADPEILKSALTFPLSDTRLDDIFDYFQYCETHVPYEADKSIVWRTKFQMNEMLQKEYFNVDADLLQKLKFSKAMFQTRIPAEIRKRLLSLFDEKEEAKHKFEQLIDDDLLSSFQTVGQLCEYLLAEATTKVTQKR